MEYLFRTRIKVDPQNMKPVWHPEMDFEHLMKSEPSEVYGGKEKGSMRYKSGHMKYSEALHLKFSCPFKFHLFPFDSQKCCIEYGNLKEDADQVILNPGIVTYGGKKTTRNGPFELNDLSFPFKLEIQSLPTSNNFDTDRKRTFSYTGMCFKITRTTRGQLISGYYYPTASFAFLSTISFLIKPDVVGIYALKLAIN